MATTTTDSTVDALAPKGVSENAPATPQALPQPTAEEDHPEGDAIRRQVEYYFSDENLPTDRHLLELCGGRQNEPIRMGIICGFKKMRVYKKRPAVIAALRKSTFLQVSDDGKTIQRKVPLQGKCVLDDDFLESSDDIAYDPRTSKPTVRPIPLAIQAKKPIPTGMTKGMMKPTGFESTYVEGPLTPEQAAEEESMYDEARPFVERIEIAIQRFKQKRRMHQMYAHVFNSLMQFGGVEQSQRMFQGTSKHDMEDMDAEEIARALATHSVPWDRQEDARWVVDFADVAKAFLSSWYPTHHGCRPDVIKNLCQVPRSFYNYLRYHNVCPEYDVQLAEALKICDLAERELPKVNSAGLILPGDFNKAASTILGGSQAGMYTGNKAWAEQVRNEGTQLDELGICDEEARIKFTTGVAIMGSDEQYDMLESQGLAMLTKEHTSLQIAGMVPPTESVKSSYSEASKTMQGKLGQLEPLGKLICTTWSADDYDEWDLPKADYPKGRPFMGSKCKEYEFWVEENVLDGCFVGMKLDATVLILKGGITILDEIREAMCSFYTWLPNELWMERKPKEVRWLPKALGEDEEMGVDGANGNEVEHKGTAGVEDVTERDDA